MIDLTPILRLYASFRRSQLFYQNPVRAQEKTLRSLLHTARNTTIGEEYSFINISSVKEYQERMPLRYYEDFWNDYWQKSFPVLRDITWPGKIPYFAVSSGTSTGTTKYIPLTKQMLDSNTKAGLDLLTYHVTNCPKSRLFGGKNFLLGGCTDLVQEASGVYSGDLSGITANELPWWIEPRYFPPNEIAFIPDWEEKIAVLSRLALETDIRMLSGVPSWMLIFINALSEQYPDFPRRLKEYFPNLELLVHGGVNFAPYYDQFVELLDGSSAELREVYPASEGFIAVADRGYGEGLRMVLDHGIFYEFIPLDELGSANPTRHWIENVECGVNYAIALTTCAGLWSYVLGDTVRFVDRDTPRILVTGRTAYSLSAFGEHLIGEEIEIAVSEAAKAIGRPVSDYSVGAIYPQNPGELGGHLFILEFADGVVDQLQIDNFLALLDKRLCEQNEDYEAHRADGFGLNPPQANAVPSGTFAAWMKSRGKLGGQNKVPRIIAEPELFKNLCDFVKQ